MKEIIELIQESYKAKIPKEKLKQEIEEIIGIPAMDAPCISAKSGLNVDQVLERIVSDIPAPQGDREGKLKCLIFDSFYDNYKGAISYVRVKEGTVKIGDEKQEFVGVPSNSTVHSYGDYVITESKEGMIQEVDAIL